MQESRPLDTVRRPLLRRAGWLFDGPLLGPMVGFAASTIIAVGPWLMSILALSLISLTLTPVLGTSGIADVRLSVAYAFGLALLVSAPVVVLTARLVRNAAEKDGGRLVTELYAACLLVAGGGTQLLAIATVVGFGIMPAELAIAFVVLASTCALLLTGFGMLMALQEYWRLIATFFFGIAVGLSAALLTSAWTTTVESLIWSFAIGFWVTHQMMFSRTGPAEVVTLEGLGEAFATMRREATQSRLLFWGLVFATLGVWVDKCIFWFQPTGVVTKSGFYHFPTYDSVMFIAHLSMIPTLAAWFLFQRRVLEPEVREFWHLTGRQPTRAALAEATDRLQELIWGAVFRILFVQMVCSVFLIMMAPEIIRRFGLRFDQMELLQVGFVAIFLQSLLFVSSSILVLCGKIYLFMIVNLLFFSTNLIFGLVALKMFGISAYGVFVASLVSGALCFILAYRTLGDFVFVVFVKENDGLYMPPRSLMGGAACAAYSRLHKALAAMSRRTSAIPTVPEPSGSVSGNHQPTRPATGSVEGK